MGIVSIFESIYFRNVVAVVTVVFKIPLRMPLAILVGITLIFDSVVFQAVK